MLRNLSNNQLLLTGVGLVLLIEFFTNAWVGLGESRKSLSVEPWDKSVLEAQDAVILAVVNDVFGLKPEPDPKAEEKRKAQAEAEAARLARELAEQQKQKVIAVGADNIRLFGISISEGNHLALMKIDAAAGDRLLSLAQGEAFAMQDGKVVITIDKVLSSEILLSIDNKTNNEKSSFNLVIFNYGL